jgi:hypothetical protein
MPPILTAPQRLPKLPQPGAVPESELADLDYMTARIGTGFGPTTEMVAGQVYGAAHFGALAVSPPLAVQLSKLGYAVMAFQDGEKSYTQADHEMIDLVLPLDSGYWAFLAGHTPAAIAGGIRIEAIEALRDRRDDLLTAEEREQVEFIRAVRDGVMSDERWARMMQRMGSERGVVEYVYLICLLIFHHRFCRAVGVPEMQRDAFDRMLQEFKDGTRAIPPRYTDYRPNPK